jgi:DNA polymerase/3'-5' exonuclease PolX
VSQGEWVPYIDALARAEHLVTLLRPACERIEIAGSLRREKAAVHDIELVAVPRFEERAGADLWETAETVDLLDERIRDLLSEEELEARLVANNRADGSVDFQRKLGPAFKALVYWNIPVDLFIVRPPATWGCIFALRTGPGDWNTKLVTECKTIGRRVAGGQVERWDGHAWAPVPTPEEQDFFRELGQPWVEPRERHVGRIHICRAITERLPA